MCFFNISTELNVIGIECEIFDKLLKDINIHKKLIEKEYDS